jgi:hypothetical protein
LAEGSGLFYREITAGRKITQGLNTLAMNAPLVSRFVSSPLDAYDHLSITLSKILDATD